MLPKRAVKAFLNRPRDDCRSYKKLSSQELERRKLALPVVPPIWKKLRRPQRVCFLIGAEYKRFAFWLDLGVGKTMLSIALARYFKKANVAKHFLVLVPNNINRFEWLDEVKKHSPGTVSQILVGSSQSKWNTLNTGDALFTIGTYAGIVRMVSKIVVTKKGKHRLKLDRKLIKTMTNQFDGVILDESTSVGKKSSLQFRACRFIAKNAEVIIALSGMPFGRDPTPLWSQMYLIDKGASLGESLGLFRSAFFTTSENHWGGQEHTFSSKKKGLLHRFLAHRSIRYEANQADLPKVTSIVKEIRLARDAQESYNQARENIIAAHGNYQEMKNAFLRMRQISSGFLGYYDDEKGAKAQYTFAQNPKLEMLLSILQSVGHKAVVFHEYIYSGAVISRELTRLGIKHARIWGGTKDAKAELTQFKNDPDCVVFLVNNSAGSYGLNLQVARYVIYYESPVSPMIRKQTERRVERQGSEHDVVFRYDLIVKGTVDQQILDYHREGKSLFDAIINGEAKPI